MNNLVLSRGIGQSVFIGRNIQPKRAVETCDLRVMLKGLYELKRSCVGLIEITGNEESSMEIALAEGHKNPVEIGELRVWFKGTKNFEIDERHCPRCGAEQHGKKRIRRNGLLRFQAPPEVQIFRGNRIGRNAR